MKLGKFRLLLIGAFLGLFMIASFSATHSYAVSEYDYYDYDYDYDYTKNGVCKAAYTENGVTKENVWCYLVDGEVQYDFTGFAENYMGWWYCKNGKVDFSKNDLVYGTIDGEKGYWNVRAGSVQFYDTVAKNNSGWWYCSNGKVDFSYEGTASNNNGCWYCHKGKVDFKKNGLVKTTVYGEEGWWYIKNGQVQFIYSVVKNTNGWWAVFGGKVDFSYTGIASNDYGYWYCENGKVNQRLFLCIFASW